MSELDAFYKANPDAAHTYDDANVIDDSQSQWIDGEASPAAKPSNRTRWYKIAAGVVCIAGVLITAASLTSPPKLQGQTPTPATTPTPTSALTPIPPETAPTPPEKDLLVQAAQSMTTASAQGVADPVNAPKALPSAAQPVPDIKPAQTQPVQNTATQAPTQNSPQTLAGNTRAEGEKPTTVGVTKTQENASKALKKTPSPTENKPNKPIAQAIKPVKTKAHHSTQLAANVPAVQGIKPSAVLETPVEKTPNTTVKAIHIYGVTIVDSLAKALLKQGDQSKSVTVGDALEGMGHVERIGVRQGTPYVVVAGIEYRGN